MTVSAMGISKLAKGLRAAYRDSDVSERVETFENQYDRSSPEPDPDGYDHSRTAREYYNLCTNLMVYSWGESLHFAPIASGEALEDAKVRHHRHMMSQLQLSPDMSVIDVGCGVGGPMRSFVREAGVRVVGLNHNELQLSIARTFNTEAGLDDKVDYISSSFMDMPIEDETFDRAYAIESTIHAPDKAGAFAEIFRILKPGALFWGQEFCMTDRFDPDDPDHRIIQRDLIHGIALGHLPVMGEVDSALESAGFEIVEARDLAVPSNGSATPWYRPLETRHGIIGAVAGTFLGRKAYAAAFRFAELVGYFPKGSAEVVRFMERTADAYVAGGRTGTFTPLYCFLARKPVAG